MLYSSEFLTMGSPRPIPRMSDSSGGIHEDDAVPPGRGASRDEALDAVRRARLNELLAATARGDQAAFAELYRLTSRHLFAVIVRMVHDRGEAEDLLQDVFTTAWRRADRFDAARGGAMTWLVTLARNRAIDRLRQHREAQLDDPVAEALPDDNPTPPALVEASEERQRLEHCLKQLEHTQRGAVREAFFSGATYSELAERMSVPLGTLKSWIRRSLMQLKTCLEQ
jgi:RNA polymerase sigma factor (sigma-70 family)